MSDVEFQDETREQSLFRQADYDESVPSDLVLEIPKRTGGKIILPLLHWARANQEREDFQENTLIRIKPVAEICSDAPVKSGGVVTYTGRGVALLRPGYLYIFQGERLWRELEIRTDGTMSDVDLSRYRSRAGAADVPSARESEGGWTPTVLVPALLQGRAVMHEYRLAYSEIQWSESRIRALEADPTILNKRTVSVAPALVAVRNDVPRDSLSFERGFPAEAITSTPSLRERDLGVELMLEQPLDFTPDFEKPTQEELCQRLASRLAALTEGDEESPNLDISCEAKQDALSDLRGHKGLASIAIPDVLFQVRHSLAQIHLSLQYLDAIEMSLRGQPLVHSATLIRLAVFDPRPDGSNPLASYQGAVDREKLDEVLQTAERDHAIAIVNTHVGRLTELMESGQLDTALDDYLTQDGIGICEAYGLCADHLNTLQKIPGILNGHGVKAENDILSSLHRWIGESSWVAKWAPTEPADDAVDESPYARLTQIAADQTVIGDDHLARLHLQSLAQLEKQVQQVQSENQNLEQGAKEAGQIGKLLTNILGEWSSALLAVVQRLAEEDKIEALHLPRLLQGVSSLSVISDPGLEGIQVMPRGSVDLSERNIIGVYGDGLNYGLTDFDRSSGLLKKGRDYLYADLLNGSGSTVGSTSPQRAAEQIEEGIKRVAMDTWVFTVPVGHPEARKLSLTKVDLAKRVGAVVDGSAVSRALVALATFNVFIEFQNIIVARKNNQSVGLPAVKIVGGLIDLTAASMKLKIVVAELAGAEVARKSAFYRASNRLLFDLKRVPLIGPRLLKVGASTLVRTAVLVSFAAGFAAAAISAWDMRLSLSRGDSDAAQGHAIAVVGGSIFLGAPLMTGLLAIPGWGWAILGLGLTVGGTLFANHVTDDRFERLLKNGPLGICPLVAPAHADADYYGQLLSLLMPIQAKAQRYADIESDPWFDHRNPDYSPEPDDYVVTLMTPLVSQLRHITECRPGEPPRSFSIVVQEVGYTESQTDTGNLRGGVVQETRVSNVTPLTRITARQSLPMQSSIRFLVKRGLKGKTEEGFFYRESTHTTLRIAVQAAIASEVGTIVYPTPLFDSFVPYDSTSHSQAPAKERSYWAPYANTSVPYWFVTEVEA